MSFTREIRLGDDIDDYCVRCKRVMNHNVVSVLDGKPAKVRCRTCHSDHDFRNEQPPPPKIDTRMCRSCCRITPLHRAAWAVHRRTTVSQPRHRSQPA